MSVALAALLCLVAGSAGATDAATAAAERVGLVGPPRDRLTRQLRRELEASGFEVQAETELRSAALEDVMRAVLVDRPGRRVQLLTRTGVGSALEPSASFPVDPADPVSHRRAALAIVERLRLESETRPPATVAAPSPPAGAGQLAPPAPAATVIEPEPAPVPSGRPWSLGAAPTLDVAPGRGDTTSHVQITGETPLGRHLRGTVRALWPLLGARRFYGDHSVRMWTSGIAAGVRVPLRGGLPRWPASATPAFQPFVGAVAGLRLVLADTDWVEYRHSRVSLTPATVAAVSAGVRQRVLPLVHVHLEVAGEVSRTLPGVSPRSYEREAADAALVRLGLGVSFDY